MIFVSRMRIFPLALALGAVLAGAPMVRAQDIAESHLQAARTAISALHVTDQYDVILPQTAQALAGELVQKNPNLNDDIIAIVQEKTLEMATRRADLEKEISVVYAKSFTEAELNEIAKFYTTDAGKKLIGEGPIATREMLKAVEVWQKGLARDLAEGVGKALEEKIKADETKPETKAQ